MNSRHYGYGDGFWYTNGRMNNNFVGWAGNHSSDLDEIIEEAVTLKKTTEKPRAMLKIRMKKEYIFREVSFNYTREIFPYGRCLRVKYPDIISEGTLNALILTKKIGNSSTFDFGYKVYLAGKSYGKI